MCLHSCVLGLDEDYSSEDGLSRKNDHFNVCAIILICHDLVESGFVRANYLQG